MAAVFLVMAACVITINIVNKKSIDKESDHLIQKIHTEPIDDFAPPMGLAKPGDIGENAYFIVYDDGTNMTVVKNKVDNLTNENAIKMAQAVKGEDEQGYLEYYRYNILENKSKYIFVDATNRLSDAKYFTRVSMHASFGALVVMFGIVLIGSKFVLKPIKETYDKQNRFITNASHELKTPLTVISANNELIEIENGESQYTSNISNQIDKMNSMVHELIDFSKLTEYQVSNRINFSLSNFVNSLVDEYSTMLSERKIEVHSDIQEKLFIKNDPNIIDKIFGVIFDNCAKYASSTVDISLKQAKNDIIFSESNDAIECPEGDLSYFMDRFFRTDAVRGKMSGSGIGLSILKELTEKAKIKVKLYGKNNRFNIELTIPASKEKINEK